MKIIMPLFTVLALSWFGPAADAGGYGWQDPQATVLASGDLQWAPQAFAYTPGAAIRYIDFASGNDTNAGTSTAVPWQHHPWDANATSIAKACTGIVTYVFKRGVVYRGVLTAKESGAAGNPIRLTSDPAWGCGEAGIYGSVRATGGWVKADATAAPSIPNPDLVWYRDVGSLANPTKVVAEVTATGINRVYLARTPDYDGTTPDEPMKNWADFTAKVIINPSNANDGVVLTMASVMGKPGTNYYKGGDVWAIEDWPQFKGGVMCSLWKQTIDDYDPATRKITVANASFGGAKSKFYTEDTPYMLDAPGEYYYDKVTGRLFLRLEGDKDPNTATVEIASKSNLITISGKNYIEISGLTIGFTTYDNVVFGHPGGVPAIKLTGCSNVVIRNCKFQYLSGGIEAKGGGSNLTFSDNEMNFMDGFSIDVEGGADEVYILRNKIFENGTRPRSRWYSSIPAIYALDIRVGEIAGNIVEHSWGGGINFHWGKDSGSSANIPFIRGLMHHNKVSHSLQGCNDYGGIESWQGGPVFVYNNLSEDAQGWKYENGSIKSTIGYAFYLDGAFKHYVFNNIARGNSLGLNSAAYQNVLGYYNMWNHNVAYNLKSLTSGGNGALSPDGCNYYFANASDNTTRQFNHKTRVSGIPFESFGNNVFSTTNFLGNFVYGGVDKSFSQFVDLLNSYVPDLGQVGFVTSEEIFENPASGDFRPRASSELIDKGVKFFVPFPLSRVVGEWHFCKHKADPTLIKGENFYFTSEFTNRETYNDFPKNHLTAYGLAVGSFIKGALEDFTEGALVFDGSTTYCSLNNAVTSGTICNNVDMTTNGFILETYFKTAAGHTGGAIISKSGATGYGYQMDVDAGGKPRFGILNTGALAFSLSGSAAVNDGNWHHVLAEVDRTASSAKLYIDGAFSATGVPPLNSLTNAGDLLIGKDLAGNFFAGTIDFIRISKGSLADAKTTIEELYKWEFDGPFLRDFAGNTPRGAARDAGALELLLAFGYDAWASAITNGLTNYNQSASGDGYPNLLKYALGFAPLSFATGGLPTASMSNGLFNFFFTRLRDATDITYRLDASTNLTSGSWIQIWTSATNAYPVLDPIVIQSVPIAIAGTTNGFFRLGITRP